MKNILVTGCNGQLGRSLQKILQCYAVEDENWFFTDVEDLDICSTIDVEDYVASHNIDIIINCAAYTDVEKAESDELRAREINADGPAVLGKAVLSRGGRMIHISTDYVFGGGPGALPRKESEPPAPIGVYGKTKLEGEINLLSTSASHIIVRTAWLYSEYGRNFLRTMLRLTKEKKDIKVVFDQAGTPTYASDLALVLLKLMRTEAPGGIYHYSNEGVCSWYDFCVAIAECAMHNECSIIPCLSDEYPSKVCRPPYSVLDKSKIKSTLGITIPYWRDSLKKCLNSLKNE